MSKKKKTAADPEAGLSAVWRSVLAKASPRALRRIARDRYLEEGVREAARARLKVAGAVENPATSLAWCDECERAFMKSGAAGDLCPACANDTDERDEAELFRTLHGLRAALATARGAERDRIDEEIDHLAASGIALDPDAPRGSHARPPRQNAGESYSDRERRLALERGAASAAEQRARESEPYKPRAGDFAWLRRGKGRQLVRVHLVTRTGYAHVQRYSKSGESWSAPSYESVHPGDFIARAAHGIDYTTRQVVGADEALAAYERHGRR